MEVASHVSRLSPMVLTGFGYLSANSQSYDQYDRLTDLMQVYCRLWRRILFLVLLGCQPASCCSRQAGIEVAVSSSLLRRFTVLATQICHVCFLLVLVLSLCFSPLYRYGSFVYCLLHIAFETCLGGCPLKIIFIFAKSVF